MCGIKISERRVFMNKMCPESLVRGNSEKVLRNTHIYVPVQISVYVYIYMHLYVHYFLF